MDTGNTHKLNNHSWIVDTRSSCHISSSLELFRNVRPVENWYVLLPNSLRLKAVYRGDIYLSNNFILFDVLYVPIFTYNLLSVTKLVKTLDCGLLFSQKHCVIQDS